MQITPSRTEEIILCSADRNGTFAAHRSGITWSFTKIVAGTAADAIMPNEPIGRTWSFPKIVKGHGRERDNANDLIGRIFIQRSELLHVACVQFSHERNIAQSLPSCMASCGFDMACLAEIWRARNKFASDEVAQHAYLRVASESRQIQP